MLGYLYGRSFGSKIAWANKEGGKVGAGPSTEQIVDGNNPQPSTTCSVLRPAPTLSPFLPSGSGYFWAKPFPLRIPHHFSKQVILHLSTY
jgi:hypothetical protein